VTHGNSVGGVVCRKGAGHRPGHRWIDLTCGLYWIILSSYWGNTFFCFLYDGADKVQTSGLGILSVEWRQRVLCELGTKFLDICNNGHSHISLATAIGKPSSGASIGFSRTCCNWHGEDVTLHIFVLQSVKRVL
jgi:hypothetical protein